MIFLDRSDSFFLFSSYSKGVKAKPGGLAFRVSQAFCAFASGSLRGSKVLSPRMSEQCLLLSEKIAFLLKRSQPHCRVYRGGFHLKTFLLVAVIMFIWFYLQIHSLTFKWERNPGDSDHIRYLKSLNTWSQPCGPIVSEEDRKKKKLSQREEKQEQDQGSLGRRNRAQQCQVEL